MHAPPAVTDGADRPVAPPERHSLIARVAAHLRGDRYMVDAYRSAAGDVPKPADEMPLAHED